MKKSQCLVFCLIFLVISGHILSQSLLNIYQEPSLSQGKRLIISGNPLLEFDAADSKNSTFTFDLEANFNYWKFTPKQNIGGYVDAFVNTSTIKVNDTSVTSSGYGTTMYGGMSYYFTPKKIFGSLALGANYLKTKTGDINSDAVFPVYVWAGAGYGKISNAERVITAIDFENTLKKFGRTSKELTINGKQKLVNLLDKRSNGEFDAKYKDDSEIRFFEELEKLLTEEGIITSPLDSRSTLRLLQALTNTSYIYYPRYIGYQFMGELQYQLYSGTSGLKAHDHYISFSGVYGKSLSVKTHTLGSAFLSFSLDEQASGRGPGFYNYLAFIPNRTSLDFYTQTYGTGFYGGHYVGGKTVSFGVRGDIYHSLSSFAGIRGYAEFISTKPSDSDASLLMEIGARADYNILTKLVLYAQTRLTSVSKLDASYNFQAGFTYFVF